MYDKRSLLTRADGSLVTKVFAPARLLLVLAMTLTAGCKRGSNDTQAASHRTRPITIKGSDTMVTLGQRWAEAYMEKQSHEVIQVTGGGSGTGISALINGTTDICQASRTMAPKEQDLVQQKHGRPAIEIEVARDGLAIYVSAQNPIDALTFDQLKKIFRGQITNWNEVGGPDQRIVAYSRENSSGTYVFFKEAVLDGADFAAAVQTMPGTAGVVNAISRDVASIGYGGAAYATNIKVVKIKKTDQDPAVEPNNETVRDGRYPLSRPLFFYLSAPPAGSIKNFIDWVLSAEGQALVGAVGYYPVR